MGGRSRIPETAELESKRRGVLDRPVKPGDDAGARQKPRRIGLSAAKPITIYRGTKAKRPPQFLRRLS
jgi:hypothetical protein